MQKELADLITQYGIDIFPYLKLRALYVQQETETLEIDKKTIGSGICDKTLRQLSRSGFINYVDDGDNWKIELEEEGNWMYLPPELKRIRRDDETYIPRQLIELAEIVGYPHDWLKSPVKYRKLFFTLTTQDEFSIIKENARKFSAINPDLQLNTFMSKKGYAFVKKAKAPVVEQGRGDFDYDAEVTHHVPRNRRNKKS